MRHLLNILTRRSLIPHLEKWKIKLFSRLPNLYIKQTKYGTTINKLHKFEIIIDASKVYSNNIEKNNNF